VIAGINVAGQRVILINLIRCMFTCPETSGKKKVACWPKGLAGGVDFVEVTELRGWMTLVSQILSVRCGHPRSHL